MSKNTTHFGFSEIPLEEKSKKVADVFHSVAKKYDLMNDVMSLGIHRLWKQHAVALSNVRAGAHVLDVAGGTGDMTARFIRKVGAQGSVILSDINPSMLEEGRKRLLDKGITHNVSFVLADAEALPFKDNQFDCVSIAFGLRNVTDKNKALASMYRVLKPGGQILILEFSSTSTPLLEKFYDAYSFSLLPKLGKLFANDSESYRYLVESIRMHPNQETLLKMIRDTGFVNCRYHNFTGGIVALHKGVKP